MSSGLEGRSPEEFWPAFAREHWERRPLAVERPPFPLLRSADDLFQTSVRACRSSLYRPQGLRDVLAYYLLDRREPPPRYIKVRFMVEDTGLGRYPRWVLAPVVRHDLLPREEDGSFSGYHDRVTRLLNPAWRRRLGLGRRRYALVINNLEAVDFELWSWTRDFLRGLYREVGMNNGGSYFALFMGDYFRTSFGAHWDPESVFSFPVIGRKAMRTWPSSYVEANPELRRSVSYARFLDASTVHSAGPGGFVYWPSDAWHIAESDGELSVSMVLGLQVYPAKGAVVAGEPRDSKTVPFDPDDLQRAAENIPHGLVLPRRGSPGPYWVNLATAMGCLYPPEPHSEELPRDGVVRCQSPIVRVRLGFGRLLVGANGHSIETHDEPAIGRLLDELSSGEPMSVREAAARYSGSLTQDHLFALLENLYQCRAFVTVHRSTERSAILE